MPTETEQPHNLATEYDMQCPKCKQSDELAVGFRARGQLTAEGIKDYADPEWHDTDDCRCPVCGYDGEVSEFRIPKTAIDVCLAALFLVANNVMNQRFDKEALYEAAQEAIEYTNQHGKGDQ